MQAKKTLGQRLREKEAARKNELGILTDADELAEEDVVKLARKNTAQAVATLVYWMNQRIPALAGASIKAAEVLLSRGHGAAPQKVEHAGPDGAALPMKIEIAFVSRQEVLAREGRVIEGKSTELVSQPPDFAQSAALAEAALKPKIVLRKINSGG